MITEVFETVLGTMSELYDQMIVEDPAQVQFTTRAKRESISSMPRRANSLRLIIVSKLLYGRHSVTDLTCSSRSVALLLHIR